MIRVDPEQPDGDYGIKVKQFAARYIAVRSLYQPRNLRSVYREYLEALTAYLSPALSNCRLGLDLEASSLAVYLGRPGYRMDWHNDVGDRSIFDALVYLEDDGLTPEDGGGLEISKIRYDEVGKVVGREVVARFAPTHGRVVIINCINPCFEHRVTELKRRDVNRYSILTSSGMIDAPNWHREYDPTIIDPEAHAHIMGQENPV